MREQHSIQRRRQLSLPGKDFELRRVSKADTCEAVQETFLRILSERPQATADAIREYLSIPVDALHNIGPAFNELRRTRQIVSVGNWLSTRPEARRRSLKIWQLASKSDN